MHIEADDILHLGGQSRIGGPFKGAQAMRLQAVSVSALEGQHRWA